MYYTTTSVATYGTKLRAKLDPKHVSNRSFGAVRRGKPSDETVEREFQEKLTGGWNVKRSNRCTVCFQVRATNGTCGCTE